MNRKLIRPSIADIKNKEHDGSYKKNDDHNLNKPAIPRAALPTPDGSAVLPNSKGKKMPPPIETHAEVFYYKKQIDTHTLMVIVLQDGEEIEGTIEWYDRKALKINCTNRPNVMLLKHNIKYMFKAEDRKKNSGSSGK
jgi:sRNA-binding regulator protein Hfq